MRERSGKALAEFDALASSSSLSVNLRHEEQTFDDIVMVAAGADLLIVPAGVDRIGEPAQYGDELAAQLSAARLAPVLRVRNHRTNVDRVLLIVSNSDQCGRLALALIRTGLWRNAVIRIATVAEQQRQHVARLADEQASLLIAHGYDVKRLPTIDLDEDQDALQGRVGTVDAVVTGVLSNRRGWFGAVREDIHEIAARNAPLILLP
jgi:acyl-coenzyme A synthetase/AMP-(fatty) acid ligase